MAADIDVNGIDRRRSALRQRIRDLDRAQCKTARELNRALLEQAKAGVELMRLDVVKAVVDCYANLVRRTPVDTGRARASWQVTGDKSDLNFIPGTSQQEIARALAGAIRNSVFQPTDAIYVFTNVEYVIALNAGWSKKQPGGFIDQFLQELRSELFKAATARGNDA